MPKSKKKNHYFTQDHENAIVAYAKTDDIKVRTELYINWIEPAFNEMVDKIIYTYKFTNLPNIDVLKDECKIWLTTILDKYDPNKGSKAFSYFSVITKNWFIHKVKKTTLENKREVQLDQIPKNVEIRQFTVVNEYESKRLEKEFWMNFWEEVNSWETANMKPNEEKVYEAVRLIFSNPDRIDIFNKKAIYFYIREITGLNTKQVVNNLNKMRVKYRVFKKKWDKGDL
tara:strand:- start:9025 stop:9708 length:684 start_codon:yes stop_codon:yes gene_type:complete